MPTTNPGASALAPLPDGSSAGELIPELLRRVEPEQMGLAVGGQDLAVAGGG
jgi:hypothetical protein